MLLVLQVTHVQTEGVGLLLRPQWTSAAAASRILLQWESHTGCNVCTNHIFLPKVRVPRVCLVINACNLWQISLDSCVGIYFTLVSFLSFRTDVRSESTKTSLANICQWLPLTVSHPQIFCFDSFGPAAFCLHLQLSIIS